MTASATSNRVPDHSVDTQFIERWSPRAFSEATISDGELLDFFEAARWAPSASNNQPWRFAYGLRGDAGFVAIADALMPFNAGWAAKAAALVLIGSKMTVLKGTEEVPNVAHAFDAGAAWSNFALQAHLKGWVAHAMGGFDHAKATANLKIPAGHALHAVVAVGRIGDRASLPDALQVREIPSLREPLGKTVRRGGFPS